MKSSGVKKLRYLEERKIVQLYDPKKARVRKRINERQGVICYVLHNSLPYSSGGYATRAHGLASGLKDKGFKVISLTRPGFPTDTTKISLGNVSNHSIDGIEYLRELVPFRNTNTVFSYMKKSIKVYEARFEEIRPELVIAASFPLSALPAIIAAKNLGIPVIYEIRGLEEITKLSLDASFLNTDEYRAKVKLETVTASIANHVFTLTQSMKDEFISRGIVAEKISIIPNSCDPYLFEPKPRDENLVKKYLIEKNEIIFGYVGSFVFYEGLEDLIHACKILKESGVNFRFLIVGSEGASGNVNGKLTKKLRSLIDKLGLIDHVIMTGRVPYSEVTDYYSIIDVCVYPRRPLPVCEMVSPMKPLEALALGKAVLASNVNAIAEIIQDGETGLLFNKGEINSLSEKMLLLANNSVLRNELGENAKAFIKENRSWSSTAKQASEVMSRVISDATQGASKASPTSNDPKWLSQINPTFKEKCDVVNVKDWSLSPEAQLLREDYVDRFGEDRVSRRIPKSNWARADVCWQNIEKNLSTIDIGSGLGEFINLFSMNHPNTPIASVDVRDWDLYFDRTGRIQRIYKSIFDLSVDEEREIVTCFEVIEHLPSDRVKEAVDILRSIAKKKLYISVPFLEPIPMYKGHVTRFTETKLIELFPDAKFTIFAKGISHPTKVHAWILADITTA